MYPKHKFFLCQDIYLLLIICVFLSLLTACNQEAEAPAVYYPLEQSPRQAYWAALDSNGLSNSQMAQVWQSAADQAMKDSIRLRLPFRETGYFNAADPIAFCYQMKLKAGESLRMKLITEPDSILFFADLFLLVPTDSMMQYQHVYNGENYEMDSLAFEVEEEGLYLLRIQPELLATGRFTLEIVSQPIYGSFPVSGKQNRHIWSFFGDPRDGGRRKHKGIDIFARRGTPVVASTDGVIRSVRDQGLGGKQVWLYDPSRSQSLYYAHLDSQLVQEGQKVLAGDTLGTVGNTGNAKGTAPHLHFSIYKRGFGAIDPHPFVAYQTKKGPSIQSDLSKLGSVLRTRSANTDLFSAPQVRSKKIKKLDRHLPLEITAASKYWYRVRSPEGLSGYLPVNNLEEISKVISTVKVPQKTELKVAPNPQAVAIQVLEMESEISIVGKADQFHFVRSEEGTLGWIKGTEN